MKESVLMGRRAFYVLCVLTVVAVSMYAFAQEGHPLTGTWSGDWGPTGTQRNHVTLVMNWDGKNVTGMINPGPDAIPLASVFLDVTNWTVRIEADAKDPSGSLAHIIVKGFFDDICSYNRIIIGTVQ